MSSRKRLSDDKLPIRMLHDRVLVQLDREAGERKSSAGILIPATANGVRAGDPAVVHCAEPSRMVRCGDSDLGDEAK